MTCMGLLWMPARVGAVADLRAIVQTMVQCARLEGQVRAEADS